MTKFTGRLRERVDPIWRCSHNHPFVKEIGAGTLPVEKYCYYLCQDYVYLIDYARLFALGSIKSPDLNTMARFAWVLHSTLNGEMEMHRQSAAKLGISMEQLEATEASPTTLAYVNYMLKIAHEGSLADLVAVLLPCMWSYWEIGGALLEQRGAGLAHEIYGEWIMTYAADDFAGLAKWLIGLMDRLAEGKTGEELNRLEQQFVISSKFEYMFWEMSYNQEQWPL
jgi:thiaminase/transcriptional activator TenA